jgi:hypothetical protein
VEDLWLFQQIKLTGRIYKCNRNTKCIKNGVYKKVTVTDKRLSYCLNITNGYRLGVIVINATVNNILVISWRSILLVEEPEYPVKTTGLPQVTDKWFLTMFYRVKVWGGATYLEIFFSSWWFSRLHIMWICHCNVEKTNRLKQNGNENIWCHQNMNRKKCVYFDNDPYSSQLKRCNLLEKAWK